MDGGEANWSESVEDLVHGGDTDKAISLLESIVSNLQTQEILSQSDHLKLSTALFDLAKLYSTKGFSLKADEAQSRALLIQQQSDHSFSPQYDVNIVNELEEVRVSPTEVSTCNGSTEEDGRVSSKIFGDGLPSGCCSDDDWEAVADRAPDELLSTQCLPGVSNLSLEDTKIQTPKHRGRLTFSYRKQGLYSDQQSDEPAIDNLEDEGSHNSRDAEIRDSKYGTRHVLILADFPPSTKTTDLEKLLDDFKDRGVVIRWVNDTVALAVFRTPSIALEACNSLKCPFTVRVLDESDVLLSSIPPRDLEPPRQRPETSARTANRLIANVMGLKLPASSFGSKELRKQEEARRNRIVSRQNMRDDAWGE